MIKVDIISGFLGAGKTTWIKKLLKEVYQEERLVLIENEFGEVGIDGGFLKEEEIAITEMNAGCICCTLVGDFSRTLLEVIEKYHPDRILIEPSGVGKLSDVIKAVQDVSEKGKIVIDNAVAVVDATKAEMYLENFGEFYENQVQYASTLILSRTGQMEEEEIQQVVRCLRNCNGKAGIITTPWENLSRTVVQKTLENGADPMGLFSPREMETMQEWEKSHSMKEHHHHSHEEGHCDCHHSHEEGHCDCHHTHEEGHCDCHHSHEEGHCNCHHSHHADEVFVSWGKETVYTYTREELESILMQFEKGQVGKVLRAKGIVKGNHSWLEFDYVPGEQSIREGCADSIGKICVIGTNLCETCLEKAFKIR